MHSITANNNLFIPYFYIYYSNRIKCKDNDSFTKSFQIYPKTFKTHNPVRIIKKMLYFCRKDSNEYESKQTHPPRPVAHDEHRGTGPAPLGATQRPQGKDCQYRQTQ
jgi:hypothetical protein